MRCYGRAANASTGSARDRAHRLEGRSAPPVRSRRIDDRACGILDLEAVPRGDVVQHREDVRLRDARVREGARDDVRLIRLGADGVVVRRATLWLPDRLVALRGDDLL